MQFSFAQQKTVTGTVTSDGAKLPGATVSIAGTQQGTQTDENGKFSIKASEGDVLEVSFLDKETKTVTVGAGNVVNVVLATKSNTIEVVTVQGALGIKRKKEAVTSSYQTVGGKELTAASNPDAVRALVGKVSGVTISATTNGVAGDNSIRVRSMVSIAGNTQALVVIDDVISTANVLSSLAPDVIQNITVLKGAQGAALYGSQGKNGVIVVVTKKGGTGNKMDVRLTSSVDFETINFVPLRQTTYGQGWFGERYSDENGGWGPKFDGAPHQVGFPAEDGSVVIAPYSSLGDDGIKDFYTTGTTYQNNLNIGVSGKDSYMNLNLGNYRRDFILEGDTFNRNNILLSVGKTFDKFSIDAVVNYTNSRTKQANVNATTASGRNDYTLLTNLLNTATNIPVGEFRNRGLYGWNSYYQNPFWAKDNNRLVEDRNLFSFNLKPKYEINKNISVVLNNSVQYNTINQISYANAGKLIPGAAFGLTDGHFESDSSFYQSNFDRLTYYGDFMLNFDYELTDAIGFKANLGQNLQTIRTNRISQGGINLDILGWYNIQNVLKPDNITVLSNRRTVQNITATFANVDLNYKDYLFLNLTSRLEGNSVGVKGNKTFFYPSAGISFIPSSAIGALKDKSTFSSSKLYANYTKIGSLDALGAYDVIPVGILSTGFPYPNGGVGTQFNDQTNFASPDLKPEMYTTFEVGGSFGFLKDRIMIEAAYFNTETKDLINRSSVSNASGLASKLANAGSLTANGFEIDLSFQPVKTENFSWTGRASYSTNKTYVNDAGETGEILLYGGNGDIDFNISAQEGDQFPLIKGTDWLRDANGNIIVNATTGAPSADPKLKVLGKATPDYILGFTNTFVYKGIGLSFTADYRTGHSFISQTKRNLTWNGHLYESGQPEFSREDGWLIENSVYDNPATPAIGDYIPNTSVLTGGDYDSQTTAGNFTQAYWGTYASLGSSNLIDATSLRIREIALSYELPKKVIKRAGLTSFKFSLNARNPFVFLADGGFLKAKNGLENRGYADPEANSTYNQSTSTAARNPAGTMNNTNGNSIGFIGDGQYPSTKTFGFTINASF